MLWREQQIGSYVVNQLITTTLHWGQDRHLHNWIANAAEYDKAEDCLPILPFNLFVQDMFIVVMNISLARLDIKDKFLHCLSATCNIAFEVLFILSLGRLYASGKAVLARKLCCEGKYKIFKYSLVNVLHPFFLLLRWCISFCCDIKTTNQVYVRCKQHIFIWRYKSSYMFRLFISRLRKIIKHITLYICIRVIERILIVGVKSYLFVFLSRAWWWLDK
jgi:hypothetical protein